MTYTLGTAAKATGLSKPTIQRAIKSGKISATKNESGAYSIDPAELHRVYPPVSSNSNKKDNGNGTLKQYETPNNNSALQREVELLREQLEREQETISDLRRRLDESEDERRRNAEQLTGLLTHIQKQEQEKKPEQDLAPPKTGFWGRLFGDGA